MADRETAEKNEVQMYRKLIARYAAGLVEDGDSSSSIQAATHCRCWIISSVANVTVITNNGKAIGREYYDGISIILTGGELRHPKDAMVGMTFAIRSVQNVFPKKAFMGCSGISMLSGMTTEIAAEVKVNEVMIQNVTEDVYLLADHTKIGKNSSFTSSPIQGIKHLITDEKAPQDVLDELRSAGVLIHQVHKGDFEI
ncbi:MAG: DeoR/GlpR family DNA-binding transcription regulator [Mediterraneibacter gnavus]